MSKYSNSKRLMSILLALSIIVGSLSLGAILANAVKTVCLTEIEYEKKFNKFISDSRWSDGVWWGVNIWGKHIGPKLSETSTGTCYAYGQDFYAYFTGDLTSLLKNVSRCDISANDIRSGDIIRINGDAHTLCVLKRNGNKLYTAEGNYSGKVRVTDSGYYIKDGSLCYKNWGKEYKAPITYVVRFIDFVDTNSLVGYKEYDKSVKMVTIRNGATVKVNPYAESDIVKTLGAKNTEITVTGEIVNHYGNTWYKTSGGWIFSERVQPVQGQTVVIQNQQYSTKKTSWYKKAEETSKPTPVTLTQTTDGKYTIPANKPERPGYTFLGYTDKANCTSASDVKYYPGDTVDISGKSIYPIWKKGKPDMELSAYSKTIDLTGKDIATATVTLTSKGDYSSSDYSVICKSGDTSIVSAKSELKSIKGEFFDFMGWDKMVSTITVTALNPGSEDISISIVDKGGKVLAVQSLHVNIQKRYDITYNEVSGISKQTKEFGKDLTLSYSVPTMSNKDFIGWATTSNSSVPQYGPGDVFKGNYNLNLYPVWQNKNAIIIDEESTSNTLVLSGYGYMPNYINGNSEWKSYSGVTTIIVGNGIKSIGSYSFAGFTKVADVQLPGTLTMIGSKAFANCTSLKSISIPVTVTKIGDKAFSGCSMLKQAVLDQASSLQKVPRKTSNEVAGNLPVELGAFVFENCISLTAFTIPDTVSSIGIGSFSGCSALEKVDISENVTEISDTAFFGCSSLTEVDMPESLKAIGDGAFSGCSSMTEVDIPNTVEEIGDQAFSGCSSIIEIDVPESVDLIGDGTFSNCSSLVDVKLPENMAYIGDGMFSGCSSLVNVDLPEGLGELGEGAFMQCSSLKTVEISESISEISDSAFMNCYSLESIEIPSSITSIDDFAFSGCSNLSKVDIEDGVTSIGAYSFASCSALKTIDIPVTVKSINEGAFMDCSSLENVEIYETDMAFGDEAFAGCIKLKEIYIPEGTTSMGENVFDQCADTLKVMSFSSSSVLNEVKEEAANVEIIVPAESVSLDKSSLEITAGDGIQLKASVYPSNATDQDIIWTSDCESVATVSDDGIVAGISSGNATITGMTVDGKFYDECEISVSIPVKSVKIDNSISDTFVGSSHCLSVDIYPQNATDDTVMWSTSNSNIISVDDNGLITAKAEGIATITASAENGMVQDSIAVSVENVIYAETIILDKTSVEVQVGDDIVVGANVYPTDVSYEGIIWTSGDSNIVSVDVFDAVPKAIAVGKTNLYAYSADEKAVAVCEIVVTDGTPHEHIHEYREELTTPATCTKNGVKTFICDCGEEYTEIVLSSGHSFSDWITVESSGCTGSSYEKRTCTECGFVETRNEAESSHSWELDFTIDKEPSCVTDGSKSIHCSKCDATKSSQVIPAYGHKFGDWIQITAPTYEKDGEEKHICSNCEVEETRKIAKLAAPIVLIENNPGKIKVDYRSTVILKAIYSNLPDGAKLVWYVNNKPVDSKDGLLKIVEIKKNCTIQVVMIDAKGKIICVDEKAVSDSEEVDVNTNFFAKLIAFFRGLFNKLPVVNQ